MPVPLPILDPIFVDEPFLESDEPRVGLLNPLRCLDELFHGVFLSQHVVDEPVHPAKNSAVAAFRQLPQLLLEVFLRRGLLPVVLHTRDLELVNCAAQRAEVYRVK